MYHSHIDTNEQQSDMADEMDIITTNDLLSE